MRTATPNDIYIQQGAKPACQEDINAKTSHLLLAQLPRTTLTHSKAPNPHARTTSTQNFRTSYWRSYPEHSLHTASCPTRTPGRHQRKIFASPIGTANPNTAYTQQGAKLACQEDINAKSSQLLFAQLPRTRFTHSKLPNPHARKTSVQNFRISYLHNYPEHSLHTASRQTRTAATHQGKIFAAPIGTATPSDVYTQQAAKPAWQRRISTKFSRASLIDTATPADVYTQQAAKPAWQRRINAKFLQLRLAQLPRTTFTHSKLPNPHGSDASTQKFRISYWHSYPDRRLHTATCQTRMAPTHQRKIFAAQTPPLHMPI